MATATATKAVKEVPRGTVSQGLVKTYQEIFDVEGGFLAAYNVERKEQIELLGNSLIAGLDPLFLGDPGVGKTWMIELLLRTLEGAKPEDFFNTLVFKETPADDILGPRSLPAMKQGKIERLLAGYLPTSVIAYLDEIFKASPTLTNSLLDVMAQRKLKVGSTIHSCDQLLCMFFSSNELPEREDQQPMRNRIGLTNFVPPVQTPEGRKEVMRIQDQYQADARHVSMDDAPKLTLAEVAQIRAEVQRIIIPDAVFEVMDQAQEKWGQKGFPPSQRRVGQMLLGLKSRAWARGDGEVNTDDMILTQHMAWDHPDHAKDCREIVMEFANAFTRKANRMRGALEPILQDLENVKKAIDEAGGDTAVIDQEMESGYKLHRNLRNMRKECKEQIEKGKSQGHSVADLETLEDEMTRAHNWVQKILKGEEDDD